MTKVNIKDFCKRMEGTRGNYLNTIIFDEENKCAVATNEQVILVSHPDFQKLSEANHTAWFLKKKTPAIRFGKLRKGEQEDYDLRNRGLDGMSFFPNYRCIFSADKTKISWFSSKVAKKVLEYMKLHEKPGEEEFQFLAITDWFRVKKSFIKLMAQLPDGVWTIADNGMMEFRNDDYHAAFMCYVYDGTTSECTFNIKDIL